MPVQYKDYYAILGVPKSATKDEIRKAFRQLARKHHPDVAKDKKGGDAKFKEINEAYEVLGDPEKREKYDTLGADWESAGRQTAPENGNFGGGGASFGGTGFSDFFEQFFAGARGRGASNPFSGLGGMPQSVPRGEDIEADLLVTLEEALHGAKKKISFRRGNNVALETLEVRIPTGVREGQRIRLAGQGAPGGGGPAGDLYLAVRFAQHPDYRIDGNDLIRTVEVPVANAVLGTEIEVPTLDGSVRLKITPGSQPGKKFRLKGRGMPLSKDVRGDFYVQLEVTLPTVLSDAQRQAWQAIAAVEK